MSGHIIVGVDPYRRDADPLAVGAVLGRATGASLKVVAVYPDATTGQALSPEERDRAAREHALQGVSALLRDVGAGDSEIHGVPFTVDSVAGSSPARELHELAERDRAGLLVVGSTHRGAVGRVVPGSVTERVVHGAPCPVAVAPRGFGDGERRLRRVGVAYAGTPEGLVALQSAVSLVKRSGAALVAYMVVNPVVGAHTVPPLEATAEEREERTSRAGETLKRRLEEYAQGVDAEAAVISHGGIEELIKRTGELDLLVAGSRGYGPLRAVLLGGVTHTLMQQSACPLLLIPRGVEDALEPMLAAGAGRS